MAVKRNNDLESLLCFLSNTYCTWPYISWTENSFLVFKAIKLPFCVVCIFSIRTFMRSQLLITRWIRWVCGWCWPMKEWLKMKLSALPHRRPWYLENQMGIALQSREIWLWNLDMFYSLRYLCTDFLPGQAKEHTISQTCKWHIFFKLFWRRDSREQKFKVLRMARLFI